MTRNTEAHKRARKKWIENNREFHLALHNMYSKSYYLEHKEAKLAYAKAYRDKKKQEKLEQETEHLEN